VNFRERHSQLLLFCEYVFVPSKSPVKVQTKILDILLREVYIVYMDWQAGFCSCDECDMDLL
jgi:hypothetical protein